MKRLSVFFSVVFLSLFAWADGFGVNDKVLYFNSETLIAVIKNTFIQNLQLDVANKYIELMDDKGNVSIADLITVCGVGGLDNSQCRNFIDDLIASTGDNVIKPFYWADYVSKNPEPIRLQTYASGDGYHKNPGLRPGEWAMTFGWMKDVKFIQQYPQTKYIRGASACTSDAGTPYTVDIGKNYTLNEKTGEHCWCKMVGPEESPWVYNKSGDAMAGGCGRSCALECLSALRNEPMRAAMFSVVKQNGSNANTSDEQVIGDALIAAVTPPPPPPPSPKKTQCTFDWATDTKWNNDNPWYGWKTQHPVYWKQPEYVKWHAYYNKTIHHEDDEDNTGHYEQNAEGLNYEEWATGGFNWMKSDGFQCKYPGVTKIKGIATCNKEKAKSAGQITNKKFTKEERTGYNCWCKMTYPEQSKWFFLDSIPFPMSHMIDGHVMEEHELSQEEREVDLQLHISWCESACIKNCAFRFTRLANYENYARIFSSIGKK